MVTERRGNALVIRFTVDELNYQNGIALKPELDELLAQTSGTELTVVDMSTVQFLYSAGMTLLTTVLRYAQDRQQPPPVLAGVSMEVRKGIGMVALDRRFRFAGSVDEALRD